jgi:RecQ family ATP-dependent DNA helicase
MDGEALDLCRALKQHFGFDGFRPGQEAVVRSVLSGRNTVAVMPTGAGKSLCYQLPALLLPGTALVISPLVALMKDQVDSLTARGVPATFVNSSIDEDERNRRIAAMVRGEYKLVYVAPERFRSGSFLEALRRVEISLYAVDEAHCISAWGHDFRPDYTRLGQVRWQLRPPRTLALTATATPEVRDDIVRVLRLKDPAVSVAGFDRPNLFLEVARVSGDHDKVSRIVRACRREGGGIVYCATRRDVEKVARLLAQRDIPALAYHAGMDDDARSRVQEAFMARDDAVVCATNAFGMGVDKPTIRFVAHFAVPKAVEAYYQEIGRAGRDGGPARALLLFNHADVFLQERLVEGNHPAPERIAEVWERLRRTAGDGPAHEREVAKRLGFSALEVEAAVKHLERAGHLYRTPAGVVVREPDLGAVDLRLDREALRSRRERDLSLLRRMASYAYHTGCRRAYLLAYFGDRPAPCSGCDVCNGPTEDAIDEPAPAPRRRQRSPGERPPADRVRDAIARAADPELAAALRQLRATLARAEGVPAYVVFHDRTLEELALLRPRTTGELLAVRGIGPAKAEKWGAQILATIAQALA